MSKHALLILIGGRQIPNILTAQYLNSDFIVPIASHEAMADGREWSRIKGSLEQICPHGVIDPTLYPEFCVDAFDLKQVKKAVRAALKMYPEALWVFNVTCATTIMSIGAYEVGKKRSDSIWYLDTLTRRVVTLAGQAPETNLYNLKIPAYMAAYGRDTKTYTSEPTQEEIAFAQFLSEHPAEAMHFRTALEKANANRGPQYESRTITLRNVSGMMRDFCIYAQKAGMLTSLVENPEKSLCCELPNNKFWKFFEGTWLEIYAWSCARDTRVFDDYCINLCIPTSNPLESSSNEIDLAITYSASLLIAECKCEKNPFQTEHLTKLRAVANMIGGNFVGCVFIAAQVSSEFPGDKNKHGTFDHFCSQARAHQIVVVPGEELKDLQMILQREAGAIADKYPTYKRG